jgi:hypothetical protein
VETQDKWQAFENMAMNLRAFYRLWVGGGGFSELAGELKAAEEDCAPLVN